jgi:hypothetical protein
MVFFTNVSNVSYSTLFCTSNFKGTVSRDFRPLGFSLNCTPGSPDLWAKTVLHIDSNSRRYSIKFDYKNRLGIDFRRRKEAMPKNLHVKNCTRHNSYKVVSRFSTTRALRATFFIDGEGGQKGF